MFKYVSINPLHSSHEDEIYLTWDFLWTNSIHPNNPKKLFINPFCSSCLSIYFLFIMLKIFFRWNTFKYAETFLKKKKILSSGSAFTKCETGITLKLLTSISSESSLCNKKFFLRKLKIFSFIYKKNFKLFRHIFIEL